MMNTQTACQPRRHDSFGGVLLDLPCGEEEVEKMVWSARWGGDTLIGDDSNYWLFLATDAVGNDIIPYRNVGDSVVVRHYVIGAGWGEEIELAAPDQQNPGVYPVSMDMADNGNAVVLWKDQQGNLWSNHYKP